jgi:hypothetical protein
VLHLLVSAFHLRLTIGRCRLRGGQVVVHDCAPSCAVEIVELSAIKRPQKGAKAEQAEPERQRHEIDQHFHRSVLHRFDASENERSGLV